MAHIEFLQEMYRAADVNNSGCLNDSELTLLVGMQWAKLGKEVQAPTSPRRIGRSEMRGSMRSSLRTSSPTRGKPRSQESVDPIAAEISEILRRYDKTGKGGITFEEFAHMCGHRPWKLVLPADKRDEWSELILSELASDTSDSEKEEEEPIIDRALEASMMAYAGVSLSKALQPGESSGRALKRISKELFDAVKQHEGQQSISRSDLAEAVKVLYASLGKPVPRESTSRGNKESAMDRTLSEVSSTCACCLCL
jgi:hypothetical protein